MKTMTCKQLGGACDHGFHANTFEEIADMSRTHGMEMMQRGDSAHLEAANKMQELMNRPEDMQDWLENKRKEFDALPDKK